MNDVLASVAVGVLLGVVVFIPIQTVIQDPYDFVDVYQSTVKLQITDKDFCSGTFIDNNTILTAGHCTENLPEGQLFVVLYDGTELPVKISSYMPQYDTATLELLEGASEHWVKVAPPNFQPKVGEFVFMSGYPDIQVLNEWRLHSGLFVDEGPYVYWANESYSTSVILSGGASGGGLYVDRGWGPELIGTVQGTYNYLDGVSYFSTIEGVYAALE